MWFLLQQQQAKLARSTREKSDPEAELQTSTERGKSSPGLLTALFRVFYARGRVGKSHSVDTNSPRMRKQKLHNNRLRSATPIFLPILGPAAAARQRSIPIAAAASLAKKKSGFPRIFRSMFGSGSHYTVPASIPAGCSLTASDKLSVSHIVLQELRRLLPL